MSKYLTVVVLFLNFLSISSSAQQDSSIVKPKQNASLAEVNKVEGLLVFTDCKPVSPFQNLGTISAVQMGADYEGTRDALIGKVKRKHPTADAIIYHPYDRYGVPWVDVIKFTERK
jgi:hypothetical protein